MDTLSGSDIFHVDLADMLRRIGAPEPPKAADVESEQEIYAYLLNVLSVVVHERKGRWRLSVDALIMAYLDPRPMGDRADEPWTVNNPAGEELDCFVENLMEVYDCLDGLDHHNVVALFFERHCPHMCFTAAKMPNDAHLTSKTSLEADNVTWGCETCGFGMKGIAGDDECDHGTLTFWEVALHEHEDDCTPPSDGKSYPRQAMDVDGESDDFVAAVKRLKVKSLLERIKEQLREHGELDQIELCLKVMDLCPFEVDKLEKDTSKLLFALWFGHTLKEIEYHVVCRHARPYLYWRVPPPVRAQTKERERRRAELHKWHLDVVRAAREQGWKLGAIAPSSTGASKRRPQFRFKHKTHATLRSFEPLGKAVGLPKPFSAKEKAVKGKKRAEEAAAVLEQALANADDWSAEVDPLSGTRRWYSAKFRVFATEEQWQNKRAGCGGI